TPATSGTIALSAGVAAAIAANSPVTQDAPAGSAVRSPPAVIVRDASGNPVSGVAVPLAAAAGRGTGPPTTPVTTGADGAAAAAAGNGAATFSGLTRSGAVGSYTLSFGGGTGLTPASSGAIALSPGAAATIARNAGGESAPVGTAVTPPPSVIVKDASGNPVAG